MKYFPPKPYRSLGSPMTSSASHPAKTRNRGYWIASFFSWRDWQPRRRSWMWLLPPTAFPPMRTARRGTRWPDPTLQERNSTVSAFHSSLLNCWRALGCVERGRTKSYGCSPRSPPRQDTESQQHLTSALSTGWDQRHNKNSLRSA